VILFGLQIISEKFLDKAMGLIYKPFHRNGFFVGLVLMVRSVDPQGVLGIHTYVSITVCNLLFFFFAFRMVTTWTAACLIVINESTGSNMEFPKRLERNFITYSYGCAFLYSCIECCFSLLAMFKDSGFLVGIRFVVRSLLIHITSVIIFAVLYETARSSRKTQFPNMRSKGNSARRFVWRFFISRVAVKMTLSGVLFFSTAIFYDLVGAYYIVTGGLMRVEEVNYHPETYKFPFWVYLFDFIMYAAVFLSWIPMRFQSTGVEAKTASSGRKASLRTSQEPDSGFNKSSNRKAFATEISVDHLATVDVHTKFALVTTKSTQEV